LFIVVQLYMKWSNASFKNELIMLHL
jgi:hypothetical protein